jgi:hypothetical protein
MKLEEFRATIAERKATREKQEAGFCADKAIEKLETLADKFDALIAEARQLQTEIPTKYDLNWQWIHEIEECVHGNYSVESTINNLREVQNG